MLVTYKSANYLKKALKVPQPELRLYTLKLFKNQVPYCGRKWRQSNMRVITAVYLHCRPELRDEWLSGADVDGDVEQSVPMEQGFESSHTLGTTSRGILSRWVQREAFCRRSRTSSYANWKRWNGPTSAWRKLARMGHGTRTKCL